MVDRMTEYVDALEAARDRLIKPTEAMSEAFALWDADDRLVLFNSKFCDLFELSGIMLQKISIDMLQNSASRRLA